MAPGCAPSPAVQAWLEAAGIGTGVMFRGIDRHGRVQGALTAQSVALIVKRHAAAAGLDPVVFAGHSLRAGFLTSAAETGADVLAMMEVSRHRRVEMLQGYVRRANLFKRHAGEGFYSQPGRSADQLTTSCWHGSPRGSPPG